MLHLLLACALRLPPSLSPPEVHQARTEDGWTLPLRRYPAEGPPVVLVHGMSANHLTWDYREEVSLAWALQQAGFDVWVLSLRGDPETIAPDRRAARRFGFTEHALLDLPAAVDEVLARSGAEQVLWVGHSMGGMLLYAWLGSWPDTVAAGVTVCSPARFSGVLWTHRLLRGLPPGLAVRLQSPMIVDLTAPLGRSSPLIGQVAVRENLDWAVVRGLSQQAMEPVPRALARDALHWLRAGELQDLDGNPWLVPAEVPVLALAASRDRIAPPEDALAACEVLPDCEARLLGVEGGLSVDYGHVDPLLGRTAATEVYPIIVEWLREHSGAR